MKIFRPRSWKAYLTHFSFNLSRNCYDKIASIRLETPIFNFTYTRNCGWHKPDFSEMGILYAQAKNYYAYFGRISVGVVVPYQVGDIWEWEHLHKVHLDDATAEDDDFDFEVEDSDLVTIVQVSGSDNPFIVGEVLTTEEYLAAKESFNIVGIYE